LYYYARMFDYKLICTDIDGTLLNPHHQVTERTKLALRKARKLGIHVALVSGRIGSSLRILQEEIGIDGPLGCFNGSLVLDEEGKELEAHPLPLQWSNAVLSFVQNTDLEISLFTNNHWYMNTRSKWYDVEVEASRTVGKIASLFDIEKVLDEGERVFKLLCMHHSPEYVRTMEQELQQRFGSHLNIFSSSPKYIEILARGVDKGHAVRSLCNAYKIDASQVMAVGDYYNDIGMFRAAGYSVAMANAPEEVAKHATAITKSNSEDGLALTIEAIL